MMIILCGRDAAGKTTLAKELIKSFGFRKFPSVTTRAPRASDLPGEYEHVSPEEFVQRQQKAMHFAWQVRHANESYGTERVPLEEALRNTHERWIDILIPGIVYMHWGYAVKVGAERRVLYFYLNPSEGILRQRLIQRGETDGKAFLKTHASRYFEEDVRKHAEHFIIIDNEHETPAETARRIINLEETRLILGNQE